MNDGYFLPMGSPRRFQFDLGYTTIVPGSGGQSGGWRFQEFEVELPHQIVWAPSYRTERPQPLTDADLFLSQVNLRDADVEVIEAVKEAV